MINTTVSHSGDATASIKGAILLYGSSDRAYYNQAERFQFATIHDVDLVAEKPVLMPGRPITEADMATIYKSLHEAGTANATRWIDPSVLAQGPDRMIWWTPPQKRALHFKKSHNKKTFDGANTCPVPGLVWMAYKGSSLYLYAVKGAERPKPETALFQAPFFNVWSDGQVCDGNAIKPDASEQWSTEAWDRFFFGSNFTHPNFSQKDRLIKGMAPESFWKKMLASPSDQFPDARLVTLPIEVADLMAPQIKDTLSKIKKASGEF